MKKYLLLILVAILVAMALTLASCQKVENPPEPAPGNGEHVHTPGDWIVIKDPTCIDPGEQLQFCTSCKELLHRMPVYDACPHKSAVTIEREEPTCTEVGYTAEMRCSVCDIVIQNRTEIPALGHTAGEWITTQEPDCTNEGIKEKHCVRCDILMESGVIASLGHTYGNWYVALEPTCEEEGINACDCTRCSNDTQTEAIAALGHTFSVWTLVEDGKERLDCHCGKEGTVREFSKGLEYAENSDGSGYHVAGIGTCTDTVIVIPHVYNGLPVTEIGYVFAHNKDITSVSIPNSITSIGIDAFRECSALEEIIFEEGAKLTSIPSRAFYGCSSLKTVTIPSSVVQIGKEAFRGAALETAYFVDAQGWGYSKYQPGNNVTPISAEDLANPAIAAKYLVTDYVGNWWKNK